MKAAMVYSGKGGVGKTTTTANVAIVRAARMLYNAYGRSKYHSAPLS